MTNSIFQRAIEIVQKAIDEDTNQNYAEAYKQYQNSLDYFMMALKCAIPSRAHHNRRSSALTCALSYRR